MLMIVIFLGFQLFFGNRDSGPVVYKETKVVSVDSAMQAMRQANADLDVQNETKLRSALDTQLKSQPQKLREQKELEAAILIADTQLKEGLKTDNTGQVRNAYNSLAGLERKYTGKPEWDERYAVTPNAKVKEATWSGRDLIAYVRETLSERNKTDKIWGFIPYGYQFIDALVRMTGSVPGVSYAFAAFLLALVVRATVYPLTQKQLMFSRQMSQLTPRVNEIKKQYADDQQQQQIKVMELYREYGINPLAGCWPAFIQMPLFFTVYQCMLHYQFEFSKGTFLWINPKTSEATHGFIAANLGQQDYILIFVYGITMVISTLLMPVTDPTQVKQQKLMGVGMSVLFTGMMFTGAFPVVSAFVLYWTFTNLLATAQSLRSYRLPLPPLEKVNAPGGGVYPKSGKGGKWQQIMDDMQQRMLDEQKKAAEMNRKDDNDGGSAVSKKSSDPKPISGGSTGTPAKHKPKKRQ